MFRKVISFTVTTALLFNTLSSSLVILAQEVAPSPTPAPTTTTVTEASAEGTVLGGGTAATAPPEAAATVAAQEQKVSALKWILTHKKISLGVAFVLLALGYGFYRSSKKNI